MSEYYGTIYLYAFDQSQTLLRELSPTDNADTDALGLIWGIVPTNSGLGQLIEGDGPIYPDEFKTFAESLHQRTQIPIKLIIDPDGNEAYREVVYFGPLIEEKCALDGLYRSQYILRTTLHDLASPTTTAENIQRLLHSTDQEIDRLERLVHHIWDIHPNP